MCRVATDSDQKSQDLVKGIGLPTNGINKRPVFNARDVALGAKSKRRVSRSTEDPEKGGHEGRPYPIAVGRPLAARRDWKSLCPNQTAVGLDRTIHRLAKEIDLRVTTAGNAG